MAAEWLAGKPETEKFFASLGKTKDAESPNETTDGLPGCR
jgi:hypothetical protein